MDELAVTHVTLLFFVVLVDCDQQQTSHRKAIYYLLISTNLVLTHVMPETIGKIVSLYIDIQAIVMALAGTKTTSGQYLINSVITAANELPCKLTVRWISSHSEVRGNEAVDRLAKEARQVGRPTFHTYSDPPF